MKLDYKTFTKEKLIQMLEKQDAIKEAAKGPLPHRQFLYCAACPKGKIFTGQEEIDKKLSEGWLDTPAKIGLPVEELQKPNDSSLTDFTKVDFAVSLAKDSGLSHTAWMKELGLDPIKDREKTRKEYGEIVEELGQQYGEEKFTMTQHKWFIKE